jgi:hypothetical protein
MFICGSCGKTLACSKTGLTVYFEDVDSLRSCDEFQCRCGTKVLTGFGGWFKGEKERADVEIGVTIHYREKEGQNVTDR